MTRWYPSFIQSYAEASVVSAPVLIVQSFSKPFTIQCGASTTGVGGVIFQTDEESREHPIA